MLGKTENPIGTTKYIESLQKRLQNRYDKYEKACDFLTKNVSSRVRAMLNQETIEIQTEIRELTRELETAEGIVAIKSEKKTNS